MYFYVLMSSVIGSIEGMHTFVLLFTLVPLKIVIVIVIVCLVF